MNKLRESSTQRPRVLSLLSAALVAFAVTGALAAGCGGAKSDGSASGNAGATPAKVAPLPTRDSVAAPQTPVTPATPGGDPGAIVFAKRCALCHGANGHGDGVASKGLNPKPRNFHDEAYMKTRTDAQLLEVIHKGKGVMPRWEGQLSEAEMNAVLAHIRALGDGH